jgi:hypothetical protein
MDEQVAKKSRPNPPPENFKNFQKFKSNGKIIISNLYYTISVNEENINSYLYYLDKWTTEIQQGSISEANLIKYINIAFAFLRDLQKYPRLKQTTFTFDNSLITIQDIVNKIKLANTFLTPQQRSIVNQAKLREMDINLDSGNFRAGKKRISNKKRTNKKLKKTYKKRRIIRNRTNRKMSK